MGRKNQLRPHHSVGIVETKKDLTSSSRTEENDEISELDTRFFVQVDRGGWASGEHYDIAEIVLTKLELSREFYGFTLTKDLCWDEKYSLRFRLSNVNGHHLGRMKLGHWPVISASNICLELIEKCVLEDTETNTVLVAGSFDGPDKGVSGLVHLANMKFLTLRPIPGVTLSESCSSVVVRVEILKNAFDSCESLLDNTRGFWRKSMMNVMSWLRPEVITSEERYRYREPPDVEFNPPMDTDESSPAPHKQARFDAAGFFEAIKPSNEYPMLEDDMPDLLPDLRPYQRRAAYWMVQREKGVSGCRGGKESDQVVYPLCTPLSLLDTSSRMFYNSFSGSVSLHPEYDAPYVFGGILADEMGLGKTLEVLACIFAHRKSASEVDHVSSFDVMKRERIECVCGARTDSSSYKGLWVQCDICDAWQHAVCVGYSAADKSLGSAKESGRIIRGSSRKLKRRKISTKIVETDEAHICNLCAELIQAVDSPVATGATLIVCPASILPQWHSEIIRHTKSGSLKTYVYEGVRNTSFSNKSIMNFRELLSSDIVITTYEVLREDLSHVPDRHQGHNRDMRFQKRYPVNPTLLTRIFWWRVCLDEAQMVESNVAEATDMALRLHAMYRWCITGTPIQRKLDDLYGLLRFLKASPYDVLRWWTRVIRDPYENGDAGAMVFARNFFKQIMWRSSKTHVAEELEIPPQEERISWISFSPVEENFYQRQHETCAVHALNIIDSFKDDLKIKVPGSMASDGPVDRLVTNGDATKLFNSLLKLRQACCHPQIGGSGLRSLQHSPMTMEEILSSLVGKTKIEGEEALRKFVSSLNAIAAIAIIKQDFSQAASLYIEALTIVKEYSEEFRLDPLLKIHTCYNLSEILPLASDFDCYCDLECSQHAAKKMKASREDSSYLTSETENLPGVTVSEFTNVKSLRFTCENLKQKYLSLFNSKLALAQEDFRKSNVQITTMINDKESEHTVWWLELLDDVENSSKDDIENSSKDSLSDLMRKIGEAVSGNSTRTPRISSSFKSITALKYHLQTALDSMQLSRKSLLDRLKEIDRRMGNPTEEDITRVRYCPTCYSGDGLICIHCELDELFQAYEVRLFHLKKSNDGGSITSAEAVDLQKKSSALKKFYMKLSQTNKNSTSSSNVRNEYDGKRRGVEERVTVSKSPSEMEVILGIMKSYTKAISGREVTSAATKHLLLLEGMRKEYAQARSLAIAQAQYLRAHDEIKMATSRFRLKENENDKSVDALAPGELEVESTLYTGEKFMALKALSHIRGQLRYLKSLESIKSSSLTQDNAGEEPCPVCQEKLTNQKVVFRCAHVTCYKCLFEMTELQRINHGESKWVICPTCRQHTEYRNIAFADDGKNNESCDSSSSSQDSEKPREDSIIVHGSYGTKVEAVTKRILWINSTNPEAKVLVFSSWNDVLDVLQHAFTANNISYIRMKGGRQSHVAISQFKGQKGIKGHDGQPGTKSVRVLLILIKNGANGLNLLEAQHVILVEPQLNPAHEAQAISRVHRIGQKNKTLVHRFIVKDTVEESIYKLNQSRNTNSSLYMSGGKKKNLDKPELTLKDLQSLFPVAPSTEPENLTTGTSLRHLSPSRAAAICAERRLMEQTTARSDS